MLPLPEGRAGEAWEPAYKMMLLSSPRNKMSLTCHHDFLFAPTLLLSFLTLFLATKITRKLNFLQYRYFISVGLFNGHAIALAVGHWLLTVEPRRCYGRNFLTFCFCVRIRKAPWLQFIYSSRRNLLLSLNFARCWLGGSVMHTENSIPWQG
jgi:hypothetical protein